MGGIIARQPNGRLCRWSTIADDFTHYNMTEEDYVEMCANRAREEARDMLKQKRFVRPFSDILDAIDALTSPPGYAYEPTEEEVQEDLQRRAEMRKQYNALILKMSEPIAPDNHGEKL